MTDKPSHYFEDLVPGLRFDCPPWEVTEADIIRFAREFDPQPFHVDPEAALDTGFKGLAASGWHTTAMMMGMATRSGLMPVNGQIGMSVESIRFPMPVRPGDVLSMDIEVLEARRSSGRPDHGIVKVRWRARNQNGDVVAEVVPNMWVRARAVADTPATG